MVDIGYIRVSKSDGSQSLDLQLDALINAGVDSNCLKALQPGNNLVIWKLDRLGRDLKHLVNMVDELNNQNIGLKVLAGNGAQIDTSTANGKLIFGIFAALAEFERSLIIERTKAGLEAARARGKKGGRPRKMDITTIKMAMLAMSDKNAVAKEVAKKLGITTTTLYMYINGDGSAKEVALKILNNK